MRACKMDARQFIGGRMSHWDKVNKAIETEKEAKKLRDKKEKDIKKLVKKAMKR